MNKKLNEAYNSLSEDEKKSYNSIMAKITKVMNQITNKAQREEFMKNFKDSLKNNKKVSNKVKKLTALAMSALMLVSPVMLSGCDDDSLKIPNNSQISEVEVVEPGSGVIEPVEGTEPNSEKFNESYINPSNDIVGTALQEIFQGWNWSDVINGNYAQPLYNAIESMQSMLDNKNLDDLETSYSYLFDSSMPATQVGCNNYIKSLKTLIGEDAKYCVNVDVQGDTTGVVVKYIRDAKNNTTGLIITKPDGVVEFSGIFNGEVYAIEEDLTDYLNGVPFAITKDIKEIIEQVDNKEGLAKLMGDSIASTILFAGESERTILNSAQNGDIKEGDTKLVNIGYMPAGKNHYTTIDISQSNIQKDPSLLFICDYSTRIKTTLNIYIRNMNGCKNWNAVNTEISVPDENGDPYIIANLTYDYNPENIILPTQETEAER